MSPQKVKCFLFDYFYKMPKKIDILQRILDGMPKDGEIENMYWLWYWKAVRDLAFLEWLDESEYWFSE